jgi:hypothetical protein
MSIADIVEENKFPWHREPGASEAALAALRASGGWDLPTAYLDFLLISNGGSGDLPSPPSRFFIWPAEKVVGENRAYGMVGSGYF